MKKINMNIYIDGSKRAAVSRMFPVWVKNGHRIVNNKSLADIQLSVARISNKNHNIPIVLRIDGVYYDSNIDCDKANKSISDSHKIADGVIYQSNFSQQMSNRYLVPAKDNSIKTVIYNGIDAQWWQTKRPRQQNDNNINIMCAGKWRRPKRLEEIIQIYNYYKTKYKLNNVYLHVLGSFKKGGVEIPCDGVRYYGMLDDKNMKRLYKKGDVFLHLCKRDSCPSAVTEAIAAGLPVITTNACGGATEMCRKTNNCYVIMGEIITLEPEPIYTDIPHQMNNETIDRISVAIHHVIINKLSTTLPYELNINYTAQKYIEIMANVLEVNND